MRRFQMAFGIGFEAAPGFVAVEVADDARRRKLVVVAPRRLNFERRDARLVRIVRDWVVGRGFMGGADYLRTNESDGVEREPSDAGLS